MTSPGPLVIHAKLGTMPRGVFEVYRGSKKGLKPDQRINIRPHGSSYHGYKWESAQVDRVESIDGQPFYFLTRM